MAGDGPQWEEIKTKSANLGLNGQIEFLGEISDVDTWLKKASIFVLPSVLEGFPNALCEAMAAGLPVLCFDSIAFESILIPNIDGIVIPEGEINSMTNNLSNLMNDENKRITLGKNAFEKSKNWKVEAIIDQYNKFLKLNE
jgi:glycosyltransferase involved in cell wall biosynthesis